MTNSDWIDLFGKFPAEQQSKLILTLRSGADLTIEMILRTEPTYLVLRGRAVGSIDDGRVFFVPYAQITYLNINRTVKAAEVYELYGESPPEQVVKTEQQLEEEAAREAMRTPAPRPAVLPMTPAPLPYQPPSPPRMPNVPAAALVPPAPAAAATPATPARGNILERLRAQRSSIIPPRAPGR